MHFPFFHDLRNVQNVVSRVIGFLISTHTRTSHEESLARQGNGISSMCSKLERLLQSCSRTYRFACHFSANFAKLDKKLKVLFKLNKNVLLKTIQFCSIRGSPDRVVSRCAERILSAQVERGDRLRQSTAEVEYGTSEVDCEGRPSFEGIMAHSVFKSLYQLQSQCNPYKFNARVEETSVFLCRKGIHTFLST